MHIVFMRWKIKKLMKRLTTSWGFASFISSGANNRSINKNINIIAILDHMFYFFVLGSMVNQSMSVEKYFYFIGGTLNCWATNFANSDFMPSLFYFLSYSSILTPSLPPLFFLRFFDSSSVSAWEPRTYFMTVGVRYGICYDLTP